MNVVILGGDGYLGWPTAMYFSQRGHAVTVVDNYFRRHASVELDCESLIPTANLLQRAKRWRELTGKEIQVLIGDIVQYDVLLSVLRQSRPDAIIHYAEQPSAPYSMLNREKAAFTIQNNLISTLNIIHGVKEVSPGSHIVKLGTMGEYGTPNIDIEEGWLNIDYKGRSDRFLFPREASSLYHTTKIQDTDLLWFYVRTWGLRVTDLMQGPVYGVSTDESDLHDDLRTHFHYDEIFGTVLNRFIVQALVGHPLTIYGTGGQKRGYINLMDTLQCVYLSAVQPADVGELRIFNQVTEVFSVNELAGMVQRIGKALGYDVRMHHIANPRKEKEDHYYNPKYTGLIELGLEPHYLSDEVLTGMFGLLRQYRNRINTEAIFRGVTW